MLSISLWHISGGISVHSFATLSHNSCTPLMVCHIVGVWPWDIARGVQWDLGQGIEQATSWEWCCCQKITVLPFLRCVLGHCPIGNTTYPQPSSNFQCSPSSKISQYCTASIFPYTSISVPTPFQLIYPQIIKLFPPPCLTVGVVVLSDTDSPCCFQTYTFPSDPILLSFVSSVHNTLFQSSTV